jgi:Pyruvate/2-oxoacid:ferredoxin oxidoreductase delta subunit
MSLTRKEFFQQGILSLGRTVLDIAGTLQGNIAEPAVIQPHEPPLEPRADMVATAFNERCLARSCGCFSCVERCEAQAIQVAPSEGVRIEVTSCTGCGTCEYVCPVLPKAVVLVPRG